MARRQVHTGRDSHVAREDSVTRYKSAVLADRQPCAACPPPSTPPAGKPRAAAVLRGTQGTTLTAREALFTCVNTPALFTRVDIAAVFTYVDIMDPLNTRTAPLLGRAVRQLRSAQALTQGELAERAGVSRTWLNQLESGARRNVELASVIDVLDALGARLTVTVDEVHA